MRHWYIFYGLEVNSSRNEKTLEMMSRNIFLLTELLCESLMLSWNLAKSYRFPIWSVNCKKIYFDLYEHIQSLNVRRYYYEYIVINLGIYLNVISDISINKTTKLLTAYVYR